jgi:hypothetical protein
VSQDSFNALRDEMRARFDKQVRYRRNSVAVRASGGTAQLSVILKYRAGNAGGAANATIPGGAGGVGGSAANANLLLPPAANCLSVNEEPPQAPPGAATGDHAVISVAGLFPHNVNQLRQLDADAIRALIVTYNDNFGIVAGDTLEQRRTKFEKWICNE